MFVGLGVDPYLVDGKIEDALGFMSAALHHDYQDAGWALEAAGGNPDRAWELWAEAESDPAEDL